jgi:proteasome accessory factor A
VPRGAGVVRPPGIAGDIYLFKKNTDSAGNSYGCHENYLVGRHGEFSRPKIRRSTGSP